MGIVFPLAMNAQHATRDMWDYVNSFSCTTGRQHAVVYDGQNIYTAAWGKSSTVLSMFYKYELDGTFVEEFDVAGVTNSDNYMRDMTFDGTYVYGCDAHSGTIWCYDLVNKTLVSANCINTNFEELGTCTYDPQNDAFWVGERATGSSPNLYSDLKLVGRNGEVIRTATPQNLGGHTVHGTGYFVDEDGAAHLYLFAVEGFTAHVFDYNIDTDSMNPNYIFNFDTTPGWGPASSAGGAYIGEFEGSVYFFGDVDKSPNLIGIYALGEYTPVVPTPPEGNIFFDFENGIMNWTTIDGDGDGYNWELRQIWGDPNGNHHCLTSASYDDLNEVALTPENYVVTPYMLDCEQITFYACAQDASHPAEHFGVAVSTTGNADADDFTIIWDDELTAKTTGEWHFFNVDLREYQGQDIWVAIVHFNCTNQFMINVDDIMLYREYTIIPDAVGENEARMLRVYPNPVNDVVMVEGDAVVESYEVYDMAGVMVSRGDVNASAFSVDMRELPAGVYVIKTSGEGVMMRRVVKK